jgi:hypothetical protein
LFDSRTLTYDVFEVPCLPSQNHVQIVRWFALVVARRLCHRGVNVPFLKMHALFDRSCALLQANSISLARIVVLRVNA